jgi:hypothetical protein
MKTNISEKEVSCKDKSRLKWVILILASLALV